MKVIGIRRGSGSAPVERTGRALRVAGTDRPGLMRGAGSVAPTSTARRLVVSLAVFVVLPVIAVAIYNYLFAVDRYVAESHFIVRTGERTATFEPAGMTMNLVRSFTGGGVSTSMQDAYIIVEYVQSRSIVADLQKEVDFQAIFGSGRGDVLTSLKQDPSLEELWEYWRDRVTTYVDVNSGIVQLRVEAFDPETAKTLAERIVALGENLVNRLSDRSRNDAVSRATQEMQKALEEYRVAEASLGRFRSEAGLIDPVETAGSVGKLLVELYAERARDQASIDVMAGELDRDAVTLTLLRKRLDAINTQIQKLEQELTGKDDARALSARLATYEQLELDVQFKKKLYEMTAISLERARAEAERQALFLNVVVPPALPEDALYPQRAFNVLFAGLTAFVFWAIGALFLAAVKDHM